MIEFIDFTKLAHSSAQSCQRLFHGRGHAYNTYEHINIDWLAPVVLITLYAETEKQVLVDLATEFMQRIKSCRSVQVQYRCRYQSPFETLMGDEITHTVVNENSLKFNIQLGKSQNTGLFLDMCNGRQWLRENAANKNVLNLFAYTCGFSVAAIAGDAQRVLNVDNNKSVLTKGRENHRLNQHDMQKIKFEGVDIFKSFSRIKKHGPYDVMVCDPPSFQKGSVDIERDYKKIIRRLPQFMKAKSHIVLCLNSPDLDENFIHQMVQAECPDCRFIQKIENPAVFKESMEGKGLKVLLYQYL